MRYTTQGTHGREPHGDIIPMGRKRKTHRMEQTNYVGTIQLAGRGVFGVETLTGCLPFWGHSTGPAINLIVDGAAKRDACQGHIL